MNEKKNTRQIPSEIRRFVNEVFAIIGKVTTEARSIVTPTESLQSGKFDVDLEYFSVAVQFDSLKSYGQYRLRMERKKSILHGKNCYGILVGA